MQILQTEAHKEKVHKDDEKMIKSQKKKMKEEDEEEKEEPKMMDSDEKPNEEEKESQVPDADKPSEDDAEEDKPKVGMENLKTKRKRKLVILVRKKQKSLKSANKYQSSLIF